MTPILPTTERISVAVERRAMRHSVQLRLRYGVGLESPRHPCGRLDVPARLADRLLDAWQRAGVLVTVTRRGAP